MRRRLLSGLFYLSALVGCGQGERTLRGQLDLAKVGRTQAEVVATDKQGLKTAAPVASDGRFSLGLTAGQSYAVAFRETGSGRSMHFAQLVFRGSQGRTPIFRAVEGEGDLGQVDPIGQDDSQDCRSTEDPPAMDPPTGGGSMPSGDISLFTSFLVAGDDDSLEAEEEDNEDHSGDSLSDRDGDDRCDVNDDDDDDDGLCDDGDDDDDDGGEDDGDSDGGHHGDRADLPYDVRLQVGDDFALVDAFREKGPEPAEVLGVEMDGSTWRLSELQAGTRFTVTQADCDHAGNRDRGRDRVFVSWRNGDGSSEIDHLDLRYCD